MTTKIAWCDEVWNPVTGCTPVSEGCSRCYAAGVAKRFWKGREFSSIRFHPDRLRKPEHWGKSRRIFVNSMGDLFHEDVSDEMIGQVFAEMSIAGWHTFLVLTKRPERMRRWMDTQEAKITYFERGGNPLRNVYLGVTAESQAMADECIPILLETPAALRFVSIEPQLEAVDLDYYLPDEGEMYGAFPGGDPREWRPDEEVNTEAEMAAYKKACAEWDAGVGVDVGTSHRWLTDEQGNLAGWGTVTPYGLGVYSYKQEGLSWVICGAESGPKRRPFDPDWVRSLRDQCQAAGVPFFLKQIHDENGRVVHMPELDGAVHNAFPEVQS